MKKELCEAYVSLRRKDLAVAINEGLEKCAIGLLAMTVLAIVNIAVLWVIGGMAAFVLLAMGACAVVEHVSERRMKALGYTEEELEWLALALCA